MNKTKEYIINTAILFIGKFVTQFMTFLLLPLYTHYLSTSDYGAVDIIQTYISLFIPILTLRLDTAAFRFLIDCREKEQEKKTIISNIMFILLVSIIVFVIAYGVIIYSININYKYLILINIPAIMISNVLLQLARGEGQNKDYSKACIITGFITLFSNLTLILVFMGNADSILISSTIANILCSLYLIYKIKLFRKISLKLIEIKECKKIITYVLPMIPNSLSWWILNVSDRTIIAYAISAAANGIYSIAGKLSNILNQLFSIFNMSWQETASIHINDEDKDIFLSNMMNKILNFFIGITIIIISTLPIFFNFIIGEKFVDAYQYIPILMFANIFNVFTNLVGGIYIAHKETKKMATTTILSAIINIVLNLLFIKKIGLFAACLSTLIAYLSMAIYRYFDIQKYINYKLSTATLLLNLLLLSLSIIVYYNNNLIISIFFTSFFIILFIYKNIEIIASVYKKNKK